MTDHATGLRELRALLAMLRDPRLRASIALVLAGPVDARELPGLRALEGIGFVATDGDTARLRESFVTELLPVLAAATGPLAVLDGERIAIGSLPRAEVDATVRAVVDRCVDPRDRLSEPILNARLGMFVADVAFVRRHAADLGVLERTSDGSSYRRVDPERTTLA